MEEDISKELYVTHNLTRLSSQIGNLSKRFVTLEEAVIEVTLCMEVI